MPSTYTPIATANGTGSASSVTFSSIPSTYTDLVLVCDIAYASLGGNTGYTIMRVGNGSVDTGSNYSWTTLAGAGGVATSGRASSQTYLNLLNATTSTNRSIVNANLQNYSNTTTNKTMTIRTNQSFVDVVAGVELWRSTSAINTIQIYDFSGYNFATTATFTLYGVKSA
jgi:hypothetical protein